MVRNCLLRFSGHLLEVPSTNFSISVFAFNILVFFMLREEHFSAGYIMQEICDVHLSPVANLGEVRRFQLAKSTLLTSTLVPLGFFQIVSDLKRSYRAYSIPGKTSALVPEFAVEDLPSAEQQPRFQRFQ